MIDFYRGVLTDDTATQHMFDIFAGKEPMEMLFTPALIEQYTSLGRANAHIDTKIASAS